MKEQVTRIHTAVSFFFNHGVGWRVWSTHASAASHTMYLVWHQVNFFFWHKCSRPWHLNDHPQKLAKIEDGLNYSWGIQFVIQMNYLTRITLLLTVKCNTNSLTYFKHLNYSTVDWHCRKYTWTWLPFKILPLKSWSFTHSKLDIQNGSHTVGPVIQVCKDRGMIMCKALTAFILGVGGLTAFIFLN
jgi:hypothetical protein